ncbi:MAG: hypothetical protein LBQ79_07575 [Deltaproteobacteria bacterium]|jgi:hypothetical protein|nr:hypothetical protein [Deltaproteobacteria bacterium]
MTASLNYAGFWSAVFRFFKSTGVLLLVDAVLSMTALAAVLLLLATLARADVGAYGGTFTFDASSGYPDLAPAFGGSFGSDENYHLIWNGEGKLPVNEVAILGNKPGPVLFLESSGSDTRTLMTGDMRYGDPESPFYRNSSYQPYGGFIADHDGGRISSERNLLVIASPGKETINGGRAGAAGYAEVWWGSVEKGSSAVTRLNTLVVQNAEFLANGNMMSGGASSLSFAGTGISELNTGVFLNIIVDENLLTSTTTHVSGGRVIFGNNMLTEENSKFDTNGTGKANRNLLWVEDSQLFNAYGGTVMFMVNSHLGMNHTGDASYNSVVLIDTEVKKNLFGGFVQSSMSENSLYTATYNTVTLVGETSVAGDLRGGHINTLSPVLREHVEGNVLNVVLPPDGGMYVGGRLGNFETINFVLRTDAPEGAAALRINQAAVLYETGRDQKTPLSGAAGEPPRITRIGTVNFIPSADGKGPREGAEYVLIDVTGEGGDGFSGIMTPDSFEAVDAPMLMGAAEASGGFTQTKAKGYMGDALDVDLDITATSTRISSIVTAVRAAPAVTAAAAAAHGSLSFIGIGLDLLSDSIIDLVASEGQRADSASGYDPSCARPGFTMSYGSAGWDRGGRFDSTGYSGLFSVSCSREAWDGILAAGAFLEGGEGEYTYSVSPDGEDTVSLGGDISYKAAGIFARYDFPHFREGHFYIQAAALTGKSETLIEDRDAGFGNGSRMSRDFSAGSFSAGFIAWLGHYDTLDVSVKYIMLRMHGGSLFTPAGDKVDFSTGRSSRVRAGAAWSHELTARTAFHVGLAADFETAGRSRAYTYGVEIPSPSLKGVTGRLEAGFNFKPRIGSPWTVSITGLGYAGIKRGGSASVNFSYSF